MSDIYVIRGYDLSSSSLLKIRLRQNGLIDATVARIFDHSSQSMIESAIVTVLENRNIDLIIRMKQERQQKDNYRLLMMQLLDKSSSSEQMDLLVDLQQII